MDVLDLEAIDFAVHKTVTSQRGSSKSVAPDMGMGQVVFLSKANANRHDTHFSPSELLQLMVLLDDYRVLYEMAHQCGFSLTKIVDAPNSTNLFTAFTGNIKEQGDVARVIELAMQDGNISIKEKPLIQKEINEARLALDLLEAVIDKGRGQ